MGYKLAANDTLYSFYGCRPEKEWYKNYKQGYGILAENVIYPSKVTVVK
ncbi:hypothetical protein [Caldicellulosiruptor bescii]|nr:hypothetical protein [Caldicellulosiruptor bescii]